MSSIVYKPLTSWDKALLVFLALGVLVFAGVVEARSAFMQRRMTDADCYFRGAWAVRAGQDLYDVVDDNDWHYNYPPLLAIVLTPLADAPAGIERSFMLPYPVSVAIWFWLTLACGAIAIHWLARALEDPATAVGCQAWWRRRLVPLLICLPPIGHSLMRGQVNLVILMVFAGMIVAQIRGRSLTAGLWLSAAICVKIFPAFLLIFPLWRRDIRFLAGTALGLIVGLVLIPSAVLGPAQSITGYEKLVDAVLLPGLLHQGDDSRAKELTNVTSTDSQGFPTVLHNTLNPDPVTRPVHIDPIVRLVAMSLAGLVTLATLLAIGRRLKKPSEQPAAEMTLAWGIMILPMLFTSPVAHLHYYSWCVPMMMALLVLAPPRGWAVAGWLTWVAIFHTFQVLPHIPGWGITLRDLGLAMYGGLLCWAVGMAVLLLRQPAVGCGLAGDNAKSWRAGAKQAA
jgi:hypothetical protein